MFGSELEIENNKSFAVTQQPDIAEFDVEDTRRDYITFFLSLRNSE